MLQSMGIGAVNTKGNKGLHRLVFFSEFLGVRKAGHWIVKKESFEVTHLGRFASSSLFCP